MRHNSSYKFILWLSFFGNNHSSSRQRWFFLIFSPYIFLMKLKNIIIFFKDLAFPIRSLIFQRLKVLKYIVTILLHEANVGLAEIFTIIFKQNVENTVIVDSFIFQKCCLFLIGRDLRPKILIRFTSLSSPFSISPRISQLKNANLVPFHVLQLSCIDLIYLLTTSV